MQLSKTKHFYTTSIGMTVSAKTKNPRAGQATTKILKSISGDKFLSLTDLHGNGDFVKVL